VLIITQPAAISASVTVDNNVSCFGGNDAQITVTASGGTGTLQYSIDGVNYQASNVFSGLAQGTYTFTVKDANSCTETTSSVTVNQPAAISASVAVDNNVSCFGGNDAQVTVTASGGTGTLQYSIDGVNYQASNVFSGLAQGTYTFTVKDANSCTETTSSVTVNQPAAISASVAVDNNVSCFGGNDAQITVTASGGTGTLQYSIDGVNYQASNVFSGLAQGTYTFTVKDANNCTETTSSVTVNQPAAISASAAVDNNVSCFGGNDAQITVTASGGTGTLQYSIDGVNYQASNVFSGLAQGTYTFTVKMLTTVQKQLLRLPLTSLLQFLLRLPLTTT
jgi:ADP-ribosylglycohydrolase